MANQPWLDEVRERLAKHCLPPTYIERFLAELSDHLDDLKEENVSMETDVCSRLGDPNQVAETAIRSYRRCSFLGRHPTAAFVVFAATPLVSFIMLAFIVDFLWAQLHKEVVGSQVVLPVLGSDSWVLSLIALLATSLTVALYGEIVTWSAVSRKWLFLSCPVIAVIGAFLQIAAGGIGVMLALQLLALSAVGWWFARRHRVRSYPVIAFWVFAVSPFASLMAGAWATFFLAYLGMMAGLPAGVAGLGIMLAGFLLGTGVLQGILAVLYCRLARRLGVSNKWMFTSCAVLASFGLATNNAASMGLIGGTMQLCQIVAPLAVGAWFVRRGNSQSTTQIASGAMKFLVFVLSPVALHMAMLFLVGVAISAAQPLLPSPGEFPAAHSGNAVAAGSSFASLALMWVLPAVLASLFYCALAKAFGAGRKWVFISCVVVAVFAPMEILGMLVTGPQTGLLFWTMAGIGLAQITTPLAIGWWFVRGGREENQLQLAS